MCAQCRVLAATQCPAAAQPASGKDAAHRVPTCRRALDRQRVLAAGQAQRGDQVADPGALYVTKVEYLQLFRRRHDVTYDKLATVEAAFLRKPDRALTEQVGGGDDADHPACIVDDEQCAHAAGEHRAIGLVDRLSGVDGHGVTRRRSVITSVAGESSRTGAVVFGTGKSYRSPGPALEYRNGA